MIMTDHKNTKRPDLNISKQAIKNGIIYVVLVFIIVVSLVFLIDAGIEESEMMAADYTVENGDIK